MKRIPWGRIEKPRRGVRVGAAVLGVVLLCAFLRLVVPNIFLSAVAPIMIFGNGLSMGTYSFFSNFANARSLAARVQKLEEENVALAVENRTLLEQVRDLGGGLSREGIRAGVISRPPVAAYDTLILSVGSDGGVVHGMAAYGSGGVPIGTVSSVTPSFARVTLFSAPGVETSAWVGSEHVPVTLRGRGAGTFAASVPRGSQVAAGETVFLAGPGAVVVGSVRRVGGDAFDPVATLFIQPVINPFSITLVTLRESGATAFTETTSP